jgi:hypothetical protein
MSTITTKDGVERDLTQASSHFTAACSTRGYTGSESH